MSPGEEWADGSGDVDPALLASVLSATDAPVLIADLATRRIRYVGRALAAALGDVDVVGREITDFIVDGPSPALPLLTTGQIDGYEATRRVRWPDGTVMDAHLWVHALGNQRPPRLAVVVIDGQDIGLPAPPPARGAGSATVVGTVDDEWRVDRISADVRQLLGHPPSKLHGRSVLTAVHPGDLAELLTGLGSAQASGQGVVLRIRLRDSEGCWRWCRAWAAPLGARPGFAFVLSPLGAAADGVERAQELEQRLVRIAHEVHAAGTAPRLGGLPSLTDLPDLGTLSAREWDVLTRLQAGARGVQIAAELGVRPSTVRNHLASIYAKLGVHSQAELLALLSRRGHATGRWPSPG